MRRIQLGRGPGVVGPWLGSSTLCGTMLARVVLLGSPWVILADGEAVGLRPTIRDQALAYLAYAGAPVTRDRLGYLFWADAPDEVARHNVRQLLKRIRRLRWVFGAGEVEATGDAVRWAVETDVGALRSAADAAIPGPTAGAELLAGFERNATLEYESWLLAERDCVREELRAYALSAVADAERAGEPARAAEILHPLLDGHDAAELLPRYMELRVRAGERTAAVAMFERVAARLRDELGVEPPPRATDLMGRLAGAVEAPADRAELGRTDEVEEIQRLLAQPDCRLLTLLGPGGIGKSTLAGMVADAAAWRYPDGAVSISLEALTDPDGLPTKIALGLGGTLDARLEATPLLLQTLGDRQLLLALDNAEHLPGGWVLFSALLRACPRLQILVTSRERLRLPEEWVYEVHGLSDPDAVALVQRRARQVAPGVDVTRDDALAISRVVGGSPLGIELAAPWLRVMPPAEVATAIGRDASTLSGGEGGSRHRSLDATMAHSWRLASPEERQAVEALSVFAAPYSRELACTVAEMTTTTLRGLVDKSLVQRRRDGRFASHPLVRQYAAARLAADDPRRRAVRTRHAHAVLGLLDPPPADPTPDQISMVDDAVAAWRHTVDKTDGKLLHRSAEGFAALLDAVGRCRHGLQLLSEAESAAGRGRDGSPGATGAVKAGQAALLFQLGRREEAAAAAEAALAAATEAGDDRSRILSLLALARARKWLAGDEAQYATALEALPLAESLGDPVLIAKARNELGCSAPTFEECREHLLRGLAAIPADVAPSLRTWLVANLGNVAWALGDMTAALEYAEESRRLAEAAHSDARIATVLADLAFTHAEAGNLARARAVIAEAEDACRGTEVPDAKAFVVLVAGEIELESGEREAARERMQQALRVTTAVGNEPLTLRALRLHGQLLIDEGRTDEGLGILAFVLPRAGRSGDVTSEIINPRIWRERTAGLDDERVRRAQAWARDEGIEQLAAAALLDTSSHGTSTASPRPA